MQNNAKP